MGFVIVCLIFLVKPPYLERFIIFCFQFLFEPRKYICIKMHWQCEIFTVSKNKAMTKHAFHKV